MNLNIKKFYINSKNDNDLHTLREKKLESFLNLGLSNSNEIDLLNFSGNKITEQIGSSTYKGVNNKSLLISTIPTFSISNTTQSFMKELFLNSGSIKGSLKTILSYGNSFSKVISSFGVGAVVGNVTGDTNEGITSGVVNLLGGGSAFVDYIFAKNTLSKGQVIYEDFITGAELYTGSQVDDINMEIKFDYGNLRNNRERAIKYLQDMVFLHSLVLPLKPSNWKASSSNIVEYGNIIKVQPKDAYTTLMTDISGVSKKPLLQVLSENRNNFNIINFGTRTIYSERADEPLFECGLGYNKETQKQTFDITGDFDLFKLVQALEKKLGYKSETLYTTGYSYDGGFFTTAKNILSSNKDKFEMSKYYGDVIYPYIKENIIIMKNGVVDVDLSKVSDYFFTLYSKYQEELRGDESKNYTFWSIIQNVMNSYVNEINITTKRAYGGYTLYKDLNNRTIYIQNECDFKSTYNYNFVTSDNVTFIVDTTATIEDDTLIKDVVLINPTDYIPIDKYGTDFENSDAIVKILTQNYFNPNKTIRVGTHYEDGLVSRDIFNNFIDSLGLVTLKWRYIEDTTIFSNLYNTELNQLYPLFDNVFIPFQKNVANTKNLTVYNFYKGSDNLSSEIEASVDGVNSAKETLTNIWNTFKETFLKVPPILRLSVLGNDGEEYIKYEDYITTGLDIKMSNNFYLYKHKDFVLANQNLIKNKDVLNQYLNSDWSILIPNMVEVQLAMKPIMTHPYEAIANKYFNLNLIKAKTPILKHKGSIHYITDLSKYVKEFTYDVFDGFSIFKNKSNNKELYKGLTSKLKAIEDILYSVYDNKNNSSKKLTFWGTRDPISGVKGAKYSLHYIGRAIDLSYGEENSGFVTSTDDYIIQSKGVGSRKWNVFLQVPEASIKVDSSPYVQNSVDMVFYISDADKFDESGLKSGYTGDTVSNKGYRYINLTKMFEENEFNGINIASTDTNFGGNAIKNKAEWWHFQVVDMLIVNTTKYINILKEVQQEKIYDTNSNYYDTWSDDTTMNKVIWRGNRFR